MKEKTLKKETVRVESEEIINQDIICQNINNLSGALNYLSEIDSQILPGDMHEKFEETKLNIINGLYFLSCNLMTEE